jgi:hypothetical protein
VFSLLLILACKGACNNKQLMHIKSCLFFVGHSTCYGRTYNINAFTAKAGIYCTVPRPFSVGIAMIKGIDFRR